MLALTRRKNQSVMIGDLVQVTIVEIHGCKVKLGFTAPKEVPIFRTEIWVKAQENLAGKKCRRPGEARAAVDREGEPTGESKHESDPHEVPRRDEH